MLQDVHTIELFINPVLFGNYFSSSARLLTSFQTLLIGITPRLNVIADAICGYTF